MNLKANGAPMGGAKGERRMGGNNLNEVLKYEFFKKYLKDY